MGQTGNIRNAPAQEWPIDGLDRLGVSYSNHTPSAGLLNNSPLPATPSPKKTDAKKRSKKLFSDSKSFAGRGQLP
jgi:hypothetical protein